MTRALLLGAEDYSTTISSGVNYQIFTLPEYDFLELVVSTTSDIRNGSVWNFKFDVKVLLEEKYNYIWLWNKRFLGFKIATFDNQKYFQITAYGAEGEQAVYYTPRLYKVYGYKL